jgi:Rod binding domain-containing protein
MSIPVTAAASGSSAAAGSSGPPVVNQAFEPEWIRHGSAATQKAYESALSFEETLVEQLSQTLASSSGLGGESSLEGEAGSGEGSSSGGASQLSTMLPQALTASVMNAGGLGLAAQMTHDLQGTDSAAQTKVTGGTGA